MASDETTERHLLSLGIRCGCRNLKKGIVVEKKRYGRKTETKKTQGKICKRKVMNGKEVKNSPKE